MTVVEKTRRTGGARHDRTLSLILCSRNDRYMGNSIWRLETTLNYIARRIQEGGWSGRVEVVIADWGSDVPLKDVLTLTPAAAAMASFVHVPPALTRHLQRDSPFAEVIALNAAARRARGVFIGRIDQDTLVGSRFFQAFFDLVDGRVPVGTPMSETLFFSNLRMVPYRFAVRCPSLTAVERFVRLFGDRIAPEHSRSKRPFYLAGVGIWLLHRDRWHESGGYDERMIYMNGMETNMVRRLLQQYPIVDLGRITDYSFYHLEHYHPWHARKSSAHRKSNPHKPFSDPHRLRANDDRWGLAEHPLPVLASDLTARRTPERRSGRLDPVVFVLTMVVVALQMCVDSPVTLGRGAWTTWPRRARLAWRGVQGRPIAQWPRLLIDLWGQRATHRPH